MNRKEELEEENRKLRHLRLIVDITATQLQSGHLTIIESLQLMNATKAFALHLFPDKEETYNLIYQNRFKRILNEKLKAN